LKQLKNHKYRSLKLNIKKIFSNNRSKMKINRIINQIIKKFPRKILQYFPLKDVIKLSNIFSLLEKKIEIIDFVFRYDKNISSFADLGGVWGVDGGYTFYILENYNIKKAFLNNLNLANLKTLIDIR